MRVGTVVGTAFLATLPRSASPGLFFSLTGRQQGSVLFNQRPAFIRGTAMPKGNRPATSAAVQKKKPEAGNKHEKKDERNTTDSQSDLPRFLRIVDGGLTLAVHAKPGAKQSQIPSINEQAEQLDVQIDAPAREGAANEELCDFLADALKLKKREVSLQSGHKSREKVLFIQTARTPAEIVTALRQHSETTS
uniref:ACR, YggU family COG1872 domain-containing protein n=1 Tax=Neospora caninum (strain Liverpool) TaxID=572307 RepID=A0A0F7UQB7_NEOCL|nr:TPA: ACR, YggU family COG1872 domain-containing protein [Neospora caninum Liverpool]